MSGCILFWGQRRTERLKSPLYGFQPSVGLRRRNLSAQADNQPQAIQERFPTACHSGECTH
jgi:hypothetical protein